MKVTVYVDPKKNVLDPQGAAVEQAIESMGHTNISNVKVGKTITFDLAEEDTPELRSALDKLSNELLSNPIIEDYRYEIEAD